MARREYEVVPNSRDDGWTVKGGRRVHSYATKRLAVRAATITARERGNAHVLIRREDGTIQSELTYGDPGVTGG